MGYNGEGAEEVKTPTFTFELDRLASRLNKLEEISLEIEVKLYKIAGTSTNIRDTAEDRKKIPGDPTVIEKLRNASDYLDTILESLNGSKLTLNSLV
jgi:hypothetical protein